MIHATVQVFKFELARSLTLGRIIIWVCLCLFPSLLVSTLAWQSEGRIPGEALAMICYVLVPQISCMLGLLLWATPSVGSEIEAQSWIHMILRGDGRRGVVLGKYFTAVLWTCSYGIPSAVAVSLLCGSEQWLRLAIVLCGLVVLSSFSYAALYLFIGAANQRRATVIAVVYSLVLEGMVSMIPATINQVTVSYRLRSLLFTWMDLPLPMDRNAELLFGREPIWFNIAALALFAVLLISLSIYTVQVKEYPVQAEA